MAKAVFTRTQVGYDRYGRPLYEHTLNGTTLVIVRMNPETNQGWSIYDGTSTVILGDAWILRDAKMLTERYAGIGYGGESVNREIA